MKNLLSEKVHLMCYRICVRSLTAIITYHDRLVASNALNSHAYGIEEGILVVILIVYIGLGSNGRQKLSVRQSRRTWCVFTIGTQLAKSCSGKRRQLGASIVTVYINFHCAEQSQLR